MKEVRVQVDQHGRLLFPAKIRKKCKIEPGNVFIIRVIEDEIKLISLDKAVENAQNIMSKYIPKGTSLSEELIETRKEEVARESKRYNDGNEN